MFQFYKMDIFVKRKKLEEERLNKADTSGLLDKRRFKTQITPEESLEKQVLSQIEVFGVGDPQRVLRIVKRIPHWQNLNITLLMITYFYFAGKNFDLGLVVLDFDNDFKEVVKEVYDKGYFPKLEGRKLTPREEYEFRQDFIIYMLLISDQEMTDTIDVGGPELVTTEVEEFYETNDYQPGGD